MPVPSFAAILLCLLAIVGAGLPLEASAVDANVASRAQLESIRGIGPAIAARIIAERERGPYVDLEDLRDRVRGVGASTLRRMAEAGLEVGKPQGMAGGIADSQGRDATAGPGRARGWVRELPRRPLSRGGRVRPE